jgi:hypothetical protein
MQPQTFAIENSPSKNQRPDLVVGPAVLAPRVELELDAEYYTNDVINYLEAATFVTVLPRE